MFDYDVRVTTADLPHMIGKLFDTPFLSVPNPAQGRNFPPYNILQFQDGSCRLDLAVAGYTKDCLSVELEANTLIIKGTALKGIEPDLAVYVKKGISNTSWVRAFDINKNTKIDNVELHDGILSISVSLKEIDKAARTTIAIK